MDAGKVGNGDADENKSVVSDSELNKSTATDIPNENNFDSVPAKVVNPNILAESANSTKNGDTDFEQDELNQLLLRVPKSKNEIALHELELEEEIIDAKLRLLQKKKQIADLEAGLSSNSSNVYAPIAQYLLKPNYKDIKHLFPMYSGPEEYDARKWLSDFERACDSVNADQITRLKFFRQSMKPMSDAESF